MEIQNLIFIFARSNNLIYLTMKKIVSLMVVAVAALSFVCCGGNANKPAEVVAEEAVEAVDECCEKAEECCGECADSLAAAAEEVAEGVAEAAENVAEAAEKIAE